MKLKSCKVMVSLFLVLVLVMIGVAGCGGGEQTTAPAPTATAPGTTTPTAPQPGTLKPTSAAQATRPDWGALNLFCTLMTGRVYLDDEHIGQPQGTMGTTFYDIEPGRYTVTIVSPSWATWTKEVQIEAGQRTRIYAYPAYGEDKGGPPRDEVLTPESFDLYGQVRIFANVTQGNMYIDGEPAGVPQGAGGVTVRGLLPGTYEVVIVSDGYREWIGEVTITTGETAELTAELAQG